MVVGRVLQEENLGGHSKYASSKHTEQVGLSEGEDPGARHAAYDGSEAAAHKRPLQCYVCRRTTQMVRTLSHRSAAKAKLRAEDEQRQSKMRLKTARGVDSRCGRGLKRVTKRQKRTSMCRMHAKHPAQNALRSKTHQPAAGAATGRPVPR
jgi:hypothetical protein